MNTKKFTIALFAILTVGAFSLGAVAYASPLISWNSVPNAAAATTPIQQSCVRMDGTINTWGTTAVLGSMQAQSRTVVNSAATKQGYAASAIWTTNSSRPIATVRLHENFTYTFYTARLVDGNFSALDFEGSAFYMNGTWNVWNVTEIFTIVTDSSGSVLSVNSDQNAVRLATQAYGELNVSSDWSSFTLSITGIDQLSGKVVAEMTASRMFNPFITSVDSTTTLTQADLAKVANAYGSMPGFGNYNINYDYCGNNKIDICDLTTAAANLNVGQ